MSDMLRVFGQRSSFFAQEERHVYSTMQPTRRAP